jgi:CzcA family heavy metal efflux pump
MLSALVEFSIRFRGVVVALACALVTYGIYTTRRAKYDVYPEFAPPEVIVQTEAPGLSPGDVEVLVTRPVEYALNGTPGLASIRSQSIQGLSVVTVVFEDRTDIYRARQMVGERLAEAAGQLPQGVHNPAMAPLVGATSLTLIVGLTSDRQTPMELRTFAEWVMRPKLLGVPGVARVNLFGGEVKQLQIQLLPDRMAAFHASFNDIVSAARNVTGVRGAGFVETDTQRVVFETEGQMLEPERLANAVISVTGGHSVRIRDVARTQNAGEPKFGDATIMGKPGVLMLVSGVYGANTLEVTRNIEAALDELKPSIDTAQIRLYPDLFRPANFINTAVSNISRSLLIGAALVSVVLLLFLFNLRVSFISLTAIPLSLLAAVIVLDAFGQSLNTLTLGGLAIAIGEVVDDAIIDAENIFRRLREAPEILSPAEIFRIVRDASIEVRSAVVYATFIVALVFIPVLTMSGVQGRLFGPLGWTYIVAIIASLVVALTVTPALSYLLLPKTTARVQEPSHVLKLKSVYGSMLRSLSRHPWLLLGGALLLLIAALITLPLLGGEFLPEMREGHFIVHTASLPGTSLKETMRVGGLVTADLLKNPEIRLVAQQVGRAEKGDDTWGVHYSEIHVDLNPGGSAPEKTEQDIRDAVAKFPGLSVSINPFLAERMEEILSGIPADVVISIYGDDLDLLDRKAREISEALAHVPGATDVQLQSPPGIPQIGVRLRTDRLLEFGFQPVAVLEAIETAYQGATVAQTYEGNRVFDVDVILAPDARRSPEQIGSLVLQNADGARMPLRELADIEAASGRYSIDHEGTRRRQAVFCNVRDRDLASFVAEARRAIQQNVKFPVGFYPVFSGTSEARSQAQQEILTHSLLAALGIVILLSIAMHSFRNLLLVLANLPFALVGGVLAAVLTGGNVSIGSLVGFVTLFGITTRNSIMMISHFEHLVSEESEPWGIDAMVRGASERLTPVLMTATVTALGLLPLALGSGQAGREIEGPMAIVILGGLITSTVLSLVMLPALALRFGKFSRRIREM